ncbi:MAG: transposase, partial [Firmicutes bacterium]|nr:transposase [Bacillota bacterium]
LIFVAGIIRNEMYKKLREVSKKEKDRKHYTVPAAIKELEKIFVVKNDKENYYKKYGLTSKQKNILKGFELTEGQLNKYIQGLK